jgi:pilus assembly protein FimV
VVRAHHAEFREYRSRLAAVAAPADATPGQPEAAGRIEPKPAAPAPSGAQDQVRLSKADPQKPSPAARADDAKSRERAQAEAQSRINDLEKTVADLQKLLEIRNQQLNELQQKAGQKPGAAAPAPAPTPAPAAKAPEKPAAAPTPAPAPAPAPAAKAPEKPAAPAPSTAPTPTPTPAPAPAAKAPEKPAAPVVKPAPKAAPPPERGLMDDVLDFLQDPMGMLALAILVLGLGGYAAWMWRKKKRAHAKFHDSVMGAAAAGAAAGASMTEPSLGAATPPPSASTGSSTQPPAAVAAEEVDPIAEADVYMAYGRDAQAEEILKEALAKDDKRIPVHAKLLEIYAKRRDPKAFEQTALKLKNLTGGAGPEWDKAASLGHSIDPQNGLYAGAAAAGAAAAAAAAAPAEPSAGAPTLDFDIGGAAQASASAPDLTLDAAPKSAAPDAGLDFDVSGVSPEKKDVGSDETVVVRPSADQAGSGLDFNLDLGSEQKAEAPAAPAAAPAAPAEADAGLSFDLNLDLGSDKKAEAPAAPDLSTISLDLGSAAAAPAAGGADPKWQEIATKLDLAKAYEEMGDKDGARELLNEVMKDGDAAQKGTAQQLLAKLG